LEIGQSIKGVRNPDYYHQGLPYLDGFTGIYADKQAVRVAALRSDRATIEFRGLPPSVCDELVDALGDKIAVQGSDWNCGQMVTPNHKRKPFDDARVRRALTLAIDRWHGAPELAKIANVRTVGGIVFPGSPLAADKEELQDIAGYWPDIEKSRAEAGRLLQEAGGRGVQLRASEPQRRPALQIRRDLGDRSVGQDRASRHATVLPTGPWLEAMRNGNFDAAMNGNCNSVVNPLLDVQRYLPHSVYVASYGQFDDQPEIDLYDRMLHETEFTKQRALMRDFEKQVLDSQAHEIFLLWYYRIVPYRSYVKGWKISPSHYLNQDLATVWLDK
jgi:peptide/nickel transport system substrate-binding protein